MSVKVRPLKGSRGDVGVGGPWAALRRLVITVKWGATATEVAFTWSSSVANRKRVSYGCRNSVANPTIVNAGFLWAEKLL